jgi:hypothetical protein
MAPIINSVKPQQSSAAPPASSPGEWATAPTWAYPDAGPWGAAKRVREQERARFGMASTILTSGMGDTSPVPTRTRSLLGS